MNNQRGAVPVIVYLGILVLGAAGLWVIKPKKLDGDSQRAATSTATTQALVDATTKQGAVAAASVVKIGEANTVAPDSLSKTFITREIAVALASLPPPDQTALIEAERRKNAVLTGKLELITPLYEQALNKADDNARATARALTAKRSSDLALEQEASERLGAERQRNGTIAFGVVCLLLYGYTKLTHVPVGALGTAVADIRASAAGAPSENPAIVALDGITSRLQQWFINRAAKLKTKL